MEKYFYFLALLFFTSYSYSQTCPAIEFSYDASGNRIQRYFDPTVPCNQNNNQDIPPKKQNNSDTNKTFSVNIFPNPACGLLNIDIISDTTCIEPTLISIYDINAQPVFLGSTARNNMVLDISSLAQGTYVVKVVSCNNQASSVVLKICNPSGTSGPLNNHVKQVTTLKF